MRTSNQSGLTLISFIIVLAVLGFFAFIGMKLFPIYSEYYGVVRSMKTVQAMPGVAKMPPAKVREMLARNFFTNYTKSVKQSDISIERKGGYILRVAYEVREPLIFNLDVVAKFDKSVDLFRQDPGG